jgi:competence protein ComEC
VVIAVGVAAGIGTESALRVSERGFFGAFVAAGLAVALETSLGRRRPLWRAGGIVAAALLAGGLLSARVRVHATAAPDWPGPWPVTGRESVGLEGTVRDAVKARTGFWQATIDVDAVVGRPAIEGVGAAGDGRARASLRVRARGQGSAPAALPGDRVRFRGLPRSPRGWLDPGAFDRRRALASEGVQATVSVAAPGLEVVEPAGRGSLARLAASLRRQLAAELGFLGDGDGADLVAAMALGDRGRVRPEIEESFRRTGVSHVLSVSGLHLAAVALLVFALVRFAWLRAGPLALHVPAERAAALVAAPLAIGYTWMTGAEVATQRSLFAVLAVLGATAFARRAHGPSALALAALVILVDAPWTLWDPSFQLSFAASAALLTLGVRLGRRAPGSGLGARAFRLFAASLAAWVATAPITALHFGELQPLGLVTNLVVVPLAELMILPLALAGTTLAAVWAPLGAPLLWLASIAASGLVHGLAATATWAPVVAVPPPTALQLAGLAVALGAVALAAGRRRALLAVAIGLGLTVGIEVSIRWQRSHGAALIATFLDVGQGDATLIELPGGTVWLVDAGGRLFRDPPAPGESAVDARLAARVGDPGEQAVWPVLRSRRISRLSLVIVSHGHPDHVGGLAALAEHVAIDEVWIPDRAVPADDERAERDDPAWAALVAELERRGTRVVAVRRGATRRDRGVELTVLGPGDVPPGVDVGEDPARSVNDSSLVARLSFAGRAVLFLGDLEAPGETALVAAHPGAALSADVVKVAHHGSRTSSIPALVAATGAEVAVVSCGEGNRFGFPAAEVVLRWQSAGARVVRTDVAGAIEVRIEPSGRWKIETFR